MDFTTGIPMVIGTYTGGRRLTTVGVSPSREGALCTIIHVVFPVGVTQSCGNPSFPLSNISFFSFFQFLLNKTFRFFSRPHHHSLMSSPYLTLFLPLYDCLLPLNSYARFLTPRILNFQLSPFVHKNKILYSSKKKETEGFATRPPGERDARIGF